MKLKIPIIQGLLLVTCIVKAQTDFRPGYIIRNSGDTLHGSIDYRGDKLMGNKCRFKDNDKPVIEEYSPDEILAYHHLEGKNYISKEINNKKVFLEFLINGKINVYFLRDKRGDHYYIEKENEEIAEIPYSEGTKYLGNVPRFYESKWHVGILTYFTEDAPELRSRIQSMRKPNHQNLVKLAELYHYSVCEDKPCIIYQKKVPLLSLSVQPLAGMTKYLDYNRYVNEAGGYIYIWAPRTNERLFFKTGLKYLKIAEEGLILHLYKIPIQVQYIYNAYRLQPVISGGTNFLIGKIKKNKYYGNTFCLNAGLNFRISDSISLCSGIDFDFSPLSGIFFDDYTFELVSYSVDVGLQIDL